jgi:hypothetical protein
MHHWDLGQMTRGSDTLRLGLAGKLAGEFEGNDERFNPFIQALIYVCLVQFQDFYFMGFHHFDRLNQRSS